MEKDAYYFPHFSNARHDRRILRLRKELQVEGYGIFFMLLETLRDQLDFKYPISDIDLLANDFGTSEQKISAVIDCYGLFEKDEKGFFTSSRFIQYMQPYLQMKERRSMAGRIGMENRWKKDKENQSLNNSVITPLLHSYNTVITENNKGKESKVKESKVNNMDNLFVIPIIEDITKFCSNRKNNVDPEKFFAFYESNGWKVGKNKMKSWKAAIITWEKNNFDKPKPQNQQYYKEGKTYETI